MDMENMHTWRREDKRTFTTGSAVSKKAKILGTGSGSDVIHGNWTPKRMVRCGKATIVKATMGKIGMSWASNRKHR